VPFHEVTLEQAKSRLGDIITEAAHDQQVTLITKYGVPAAYVVPLARVVLSARRLRADLRVPRRRRAAP
jgi:prevent-host-death family protein